MTNVCTKSAVCYNIIEDFITNKITISKYVYTSINLLPIYPSKLNFSASKNTTVNIALYKIEKLIVIDRIF